MKVDNRLVVEIFRFNPEVDHKPHYQTYEVNYDVPITVLELLKNIFEKHDRTLSFRNGPVCRRGICGACAMRLNGKPIMACSTDMKPAKEIVIEPLLSFPVVKDLVVDFGATFSGKDRIFKVRKGTMIEVRKKQ